MEPTDPVIQLLEDCAEDDQPEFTLAYVCGELHVTPRNDPAAYPVTVARNAVGYTVTYRASTWTCVTPEHALAAVRGLFAPAHLERA